MEPFESYSQKLKDLRSNIITIAGEVMTEHKEQITGLLIFQQQSEHVDSKGKALRPYSRNYAAYRRSIGKGTQTDFDLTGELHATTELSIDGDQFSFVSPATTDTGELKTDWLRRWNKAPIMDLDPDNIKLVYPIIEKDFTERINNKLAID